MTNSILHKVDKMIITSKHPQANAQTPNKAYPYNSLTKLYYSKLKGFEPLPMPDNLPLGNNTKSNSVFNPTTVKTTNNKRLERKATYTLHKSAKQLLPLERVSTCLSCRVSADKDISISHNGLSGTDGRAYYSNLMRCSSVWACPICSKRILTQRATEIEKGLSEWVDNQLNHVFMLTLTIPHKQGDNLTTQLSKQRQANKRLFNDRAMRNVWALVGKVGQIKALEYTHGSNGHHNHSHALIFTELSSDEFKNTRIAVGRTHKNNITVLSDKKIQSLINKGQIISYMDIESFIKLYWVKLCHDVGLGVASLEHGANITDARNAKKYLTKFKASLELTNSKDKRGKKGNRNQWQLLADYQSGDIKAGAIFQEYAKSYKGERQLFWSRGLKALLGIATIEDEDIDDTDATEDMIEVVTVPLDVWSLIQRYNAKADVLTAIEIDYSSGGNTSKYIDLIIKLKDYNTRRIATRERNRLTRMNKYIPDKFMAD